MKRDYVAFRKWHLEYYWRDCSPCKDYEHLTLSILCEISVIKYFTHLKNNVNTQQKWQLAIPNLNDTETEVSLGVSFLWEIQLHIERQIRLLDKDVPIGKPQS